MSTENNTPATVTPTNEQIAVKKPQTVKDWLSSDSFKASLASVLPTHLTPERQIRLAIAAMTRTPKLKECTPASVLRCMMDLSAMGLEPDGRRAHLIPYKDTCTLILDYKGIVELVRRSGLVSNIHADKVCAADTFTYERGQIEKHSIDFKSPRGDAYAYYAEVTFKDGTRQSCVMTKEDVEGIRKRSRSGTSGPWVTDYDEMAKKTVFKRLSKWLTLSPEIQEALSRDDENDPIEINATPAPATFAEALDLPVDEKGEEAK